MIDKNELIAKLIAGVVTVSFEKKNGEIRKMKCTLNPEHPLMREVKGTGGSYDPNQIRVIDVEKEAWRSFRFDSLISINSK